MAELKKIPTEMEMEQLIGDDRFSAWKKACALIDSLYEMDTLWNDGGKKWGIEYKYRRGGKTLCALYARPDCYGLMIIFGKDEREKVEDIRGILSAHTVEIYDNAETFHDGKWVMFDENLSENDLKLLLGIKRKPNRK